VTTKENEKHELLIDAHVHLQGCFELSCFFDSAYQNFCHYVRPAGSGFSAVLLLSEVAGVQQFDRLKAICNSDKLDQQAELGSWRLFKTEDNAALEVRRENGDAMFIIAGRQIVTLEKLEVHALLTETLFADGEPLDETISKIKSDGALPVIPWGAGKWLGERGKVLMNFITSDMSNNVFLGDNGGRPFLWGTPRHFVDGRLKGMLVLPGSDSLPLAREVKRVGSFGFKMQGGLIGNQPASELKKRLFCDDLSVEPYGRLHSLIGFLKDQVSLRL